MQIFFLSTLVKEDVRDVETLVLLEGEDLKAMGFAVGTRSKLTHVIKQIQAAS